MAAKSAYEQAKDQATKRIVNRERMTAAELDALSRRADKATDRLKRAFTPRSYIETLFDVWRSRRGH